MVCELSMSIVIRETYNSSVWNDLFSHCARAAEPSEHLNQEARNGSGFSGVVYTAQCATDHFATRVKLWGNVLSGDNLVEKILLGSWVKLYSGGVQPKV